MKVSREQVAENRHRILEAAAALFREKGFERVTLAEVMQRASMTHGAFYGHFQSKDDLVAQALAHMVAPPERGEARTLRAYGDMYLSAAHRDRRGGGCAFAALGPEALRGSPEARHALAQGLESLIERLSRTAPGEDPPTRRAAAIASFAAMLGGLILSRIAEDPALSDEVLRATRQHLVIPPRCDEPAPGAGTP